jgi:hypothetical protein
MDSGMKPHAMTRRSTLWLRGSPGNHLAGVLRLACKIVCHEDIVVATIGVLRMDRDTIVHKTQGRPLVEAELDPARLVSTGSSLTRAARRQRAATTPKSGAPRSLCPT